MNLIENIAASRNMDFRTVADNALILQEGDTFSVLSWNTDLLGSQPSVDDLKAIYALPEPPQALVVPVSVTRRQFFQYLATMPKPIITTDEAIAAMAGTIPSTLNTLVGGLPSNQQFAARMLIIGATDFYRANPITLALGEAYGWSSSQLDDFWITASAL